MGGHRRSRCAFAIGVATCVLQVGAAEARAQSTGIEFGLLRSASVASGGPLSVVETVRFNSVELVFSAPIVEHSGWSLDFVGAVVPYAWASETALGPAVVSIGRDRWLVSDTAGRATSRGFGARPLGLQAVLGRGDISLQFHAAGGVVRFSLPTPAANATQLNFTGEVGGGLRARTPWGHVGLGYRFHHLSNAGRGAVNPGVDSHQIYLGLWKR